MKFYIILMTIILTVARQVEADMGEVLDSVDMACHEEIQVSEDELSTFYENYRKKPKESIMCLLKCYMEKHNSWRNGTFDKNGAMEYLQSLPDLRYRQAAVNQIIHDCKDQIGSSECHTAYLIIVCMTEHEARMM